MQRLLIVDGMNLLFQMFYGMPARIVNSEGRAIQGTLGFVGALLKIVRMVSPSHVVVLFDGECENARNDIDPEYKANRPDFEGLDENDIPFSQLPDVYAALDHLGIRHAETVGCETDDVIASYAIALGGEYEVVISSFDSDFFQLITDRVSVLRYRGDKTVICNPDYVRARLGIEPCQYADHKSLTGDTADNVKGVDKVGAKTATDLIRQFGSLEGVLANAEQIKRPSVRESVIKNAERARMNYRLIKLTASAPLPFSPDQLEYSLPESASTRAILTAIGAT